MIAATWLAASARTQAQEQPLEAPRREGPAAVAPPGAHAPLPHVSELADPHAASDLAASDEGLSTRRPARRFSLLVGASASFSNDPRFAASLLPELGLYARLSDWASVGMRLRVGGGWSSLDGAQLRLAVAVPSLRAHLREDLGRWGTIELGVHGDGGLALDRAEERRLGGDLLSFGLGAGVYTTLELGESHGITLDATMMAWGLGNTSVAIDTHVSLSYVLRFD